RWVDATTLTPGSDEQNRRGGGRGDRGANRADSLLAPAFGQADDKQTCIRRCLDNSLITRPNQQGLGHDPDHLLDAQGGASQEPARVSPPQRRVGLGSQEKQSRAE